MRVRDGDIASFKLLGLMAFGLSAALFALLAVVGKVGFQIIV